MSAHTSDGTIAALTCLIETTNLLAVVQIQLQCARRMYPLVQRGNILASVIKYDLCSPGLFYQRVLAL